MDMRKKKEKIPSQLTGLDQWVGYNIFPDKGGKMRKVPVDVSTGKNAKSNDWDTWSDFDTALTACEKYSYSGIGLMLTEENGLVCIDIDNCYDPSTGTFNEVAGEIMKVCPTYTEFSVSGKGIHIWFFGKKPGQKVKNSELGVEMYASRQFITISGDLVPGKPDQIREIEEETLSYIYNTFVCKGRKKSASGNAGADGYMDDDAVLAYAGQYKDKEAFGRLFNGNWQNDYASQSEADLALCYRLAYLTKKDEKQMDRLFRRSKLYRAKWDEVHRADGATHGQMTIEKACESVQTTIRKSKSPLIEAGGCYCKYNGEEFIKVTNFTVVPQAMTIPEMDAEAKTQMTMSMITESGEQFDMDMFTEDFASASKLRTTLSRKTISLSFLGTDKDLEHLKMLISELDWEHRRGVTALGIHSLGGQRVYVTTDGGINANGEHTNGIVQMNNGESIQSTMPCQAEITPGELRRIGEHILAYNVAPKTVPILAWSAACFLKEILRSKGIKFPHLFLIGEAGSGKSTTLEQIVMQFFSTDKVKASSQITPFTIMKDSASSNLVPQCLDEFKPSKLREAKTTTLLNHFRDSYDGHEGARGRSDQTVVRYKLAAPIVVAGEESPEETAIRERSIELLFSKKDLSNGGSQKALNHIRANQSLLRKLGRTLLTEALTVEDDTVTAWYFEAADALNGEFPDRIVSNIACCYAGLRLVKRVCNKMGLEWDEVFPIPYDICAEQLSISVTEYLLDGGNHNTSVVEQTLEIMARMDELVEGEHYVLEDGVLFIRISAIYDMYTKYLKDHAVTCENVSAKQFKKMLAASDLCIESNMQKRFRRVGNSRCFKLNYELLKTRVEVEGFER